MQHWKRMVCSMIAAALVIPLQGFAESDIYVTASVDNGVFTVSGNLNETSEKIYLIKIMTETGIDALDDNNFGDNVIAVEQGKSQNDGMFSLEIPIDPSVPSGQYYICMTTRKENKVEKILPCYYLSQQESQAILKWVNEAASAKTMQSLIEEHAAKMNLSLDGIYQEIENRENVFDKMLCTIPFETLREVQESFEQSCVLEKIYECSSAASVLDTIDQNGYYIGAGLKGIRELKDPSGVGELLLGRSFQTMKDFNDALEEAVCVTAFNIGARGDMEALIEKYSPVLTIPSEYAKMEYDARQTLFKSLEQKKTFTTYASINQFMKAWFQTGGTSSGGGNSGGNSGSGVSHGGTGSLSGGVVSENVADNQTNSLALTPTAKFTDLSGVDWALEAIEYLANKKIISGVSETKFEPDRNITKEEFVKLLVETFGLSAGESAVEFRDVNQSDWFFRYVVIAAQNGVVNGLGDGTFGVGTSLSRQDMATMLARTLAHKKIELKQSSDMPCFSDEHEIADYAAEAVQTLCRAGVMNGIGETKFAPDAPSTRAMAAKVIYLLIKE